MDITVQTDPNSTSFQAQPQKMLNYHSSYTLTLSQGLLSMSGELLVWRSLNWDILTVMQDFGPFITDPVGDELDVPLNRTMTITLGIGLNHSSVGLSLFNMDIITGSLPITIDMVDLVDWNRSGRSETVIHITTGNLTYQTRYSLTLSPTVMDIHDRFILNEALKIEFTTEREPDRDDDGYADSLDTFPDDPLEWSDRDGDGYGDNSDLFPEDPHEYQDTDGDGIGDNADEDDDGDGMDDLWEIKNGLDPKDPQDAFQDSDRDGYTNLEEYLEGTDPRDKGDHPEGDEQNTGMLIIYGSIVLIILIVIFIVLFMLGFIGKKKGSSFEEE